MKTTAYENVRADFGWLPDTLLWLGEIVGSFGPVIAVLGAIYLYYKRQEADRAEARRDDKRRVYSEYLHQCSLLWNEITSGPSSQEISRTTALMSRHQNELALVAPDHVVECARNVRSAYIDFGSFVLALPLEQWLTPTPEQKNQISGYIQRVTSAEQTLLSAMKSDLS